MIAPQKRLNRRRFEFGRYVWQLVNLQGYPYYEAYRIARPRGRAQTQSGQGVTAKRAEDYFLAHAEEREFPQRLALFGLGEERLMAELDRRLNAKKTEFYQGEAVTNVEDNGTRMQATALLAELLGFRGRKLELSGSVDITSRPDLSQLTDEELVVFRSLAAKIYHASTN